MSPYERICNWLLGLSVLSWAVLGLVEADAADRFTVVRLCISALNLCVGLLFLFRCPVERHGSVAIIAVCLPSLVIGGWAFNVAPAPHAWPWYAQFLFAAGTAWTIYCFVTLGQSFAILPALRRIVVNGPYRVVRHPAYAGELLLIIACFAAGPSFPAAAPLVLAVPTVVSRILAEERLLTTSSEYQQYTREVRWRLVPTAW